MRAKVTNNSFKSMLRLQSILSSSKLHFGILSILFGVIGTLLGLFGAMVAVSVVIIGVFLVVGGVRTERIV